MADWTSISNANVEPDAPWISATAFALRDNPIAIAEGAAGAPRIQTAAYQGSSVTTSVIEPSERMTTANVNGQIAGGSAGAVGTYAFAGREKDSTDTVYSFGSTIAGSALFPSGVTDSVDSTDQTADEIVQQGPALSGTWRCMGYAPNRTTNNGSAAVTLWLRIS